LHRRGFRNKLRASSAKPRLLSDVGVYRIMSDELNTALTALDKEITDHQQDFDALVSSNLTSIPKSMRGIAERIIGKWVEESRESTKKLEKLTTGSTWQAFKHYCLDDWNHYSNGFVPKSFWFEYLPELGSSALGYALVPVLIGWWFLSTPFLIPWLVLTVVIALWLFLFGALTNIRELRECRKELERKQKNEAREFNERIGQLWDNPMYLISEVQRHLIGVIKTYREEVVGLKGRFENAIVQPRAELKKRLAELQADEQALAELADDEFPEKSTFSAIVQDQIKKCQELLEQATPQEIKLANKFTAVTSRLDRLEQITNGLAALRAKYANRGQILDRFRCYAETDPEQWIRILKARRERELWEIETALSGLDEEVTWTQGALTEVTTLLPAADFYRLPAFPKKLPTLESRRSR
jgi:hypothetical protein